ncbi:MAG TPA: hypothetical protein VL991_00450 [Terracidiphilus sp.]|nr:hypothetical protein [Terracidiphilus sp.]
MQDDDVSSHGAAWEAEVKAMSERLAQQSRRSGLIGFLGGAAVMGGVALILWAALNTRHQLTTQVDTNKSLASEVQAKSAQAAAAQQQAATAKTVLSTTVENLQAQNPAVSAQAATALDQAFEADPNAAKYLVRVYIHIHAKPQRKHAAQIARALRNSGYIVSGIDVKPQTVQESQVHYYSDDSQSVSDANSIVKVVTSTGIPCTARQVPQPESDKLKPRAYGLWLAADLQ